MEVTGQGRSGWAGAGARARRVSQGPDFCVGQERFLPMWTSVQPGPLRGQSALQAVAFRCDFVSL